MCRCFVALYSRSLSILRSDTIIQFLAVVLVWYWTTRSLVAQSNVNGVLIQRVVFVFFV